MTFCMICTKDRPSLVKRKKKLSDGIIIILDICAKCDAKGLKNGAWFEDGKKENT